MAVAGRAVTFATLGFLGAASLAFGLWSGLSAPAAADNALHDAAANTLAASGFVESIQITVTQSGPRTPAYSSDVAFERMNVDYQAPDRLFAQSSEAPADAASPIFDVSLTLIGSSCWVVVTPRVGGSVTCRQGEIPSFLRSISDLESTSGVSYRGGLYTLGHHDSSKFEALSFPETSTHSASQTAGGQVQVRIERGFVSWEHFEAPTSLGLLDVVQRFTRVGTEPPVRRPPGPPSQVVSGP